MSLKSELIFMHAPCGRRRQDQIPSGRDDPIRAQRLPEGNIEIASWSVARTSRVMITRSLLAFIIRGWQHRGCGRGCLHKFCPSIRWAAAKSAPPEL
jgi:hypothetical protein